ncbi:hypothetical protein ACFXJ5_21565 [Streptomyces sp. NPDC059373]
MATEEGRRIIEDGIRRVEDLGREPGVWDGRWLVPFTSVRSDIRSVRQWLEAALALARQIKAHAPQCRVILTVYEMKRAW